MTDGSAASGPNATRISSTGWSGQCSKLLGYFVICFCNQTEPTVEKLLHSQH
jgi:hypothetical protein